MDPFEEWAVKERLISVQMLENGQDRSSKSDFLTLLSRNLPAISEAAWLDALTRLSPKPLVCPLPPSCSAPCINPFDTINTVQDSTPRVLTSPHAWFGRKRGPTIPATLSSQGNKPVQLAVPSSAFQDIPPSIDRSYGIVFRSALNIWIATEIKDSLSPLFRHVLQTEHRQPHVLGVEPGVLRFCDPSPARCEKPAPCVTDWPSVPGARELWEFLLREAVARGASDIHLDMTDERLRVRLRIDGAIFEQPPIHPQIGEALLRRIKVFGAMDPNLYGQIQDGASTFRIDGKTCHMRMAFTANADRKESAVVRIFSSGVNTIPELGLGFKVERSVHHWMDGDGGLLLVSGPTGSGKTSTLYALIATLAASSGVAITIENPIERKLPGIRQIGISGPGLPTFQEAIRNVLRLDPDIVMIGEIRDTASAQAAIHAALSGHRVLSSIHARTCAGVIDRLRGSFGIDSVALTSALDVSIAQRLVPKLCQRCRKARPLSEDERRTLRCLDDIRETFEAPGCSACRGTGVEGRLLLSESLVMDAPLEGLILENKTSREIYAHCMPSGETMAGAAIRNHAKGLIDLRTLHLSLLEVPDSRPIVPECLLPKKEWAGGSTIS